MGVFRLIDNFIPDWLRRSRFGMSINYMIGQKGPVWIDTELQYDHYNNITQLKQVIDRKALMFSNMELVLVNLKTGERIEDKDLSKLIQNPNPYQSLNDFLRQYKVQEQVYGNQFMYSNRASMIGYPVALHNISPRYIKPNLSGKIFDQTSIGDIILDYKYDDGSGSTKTYKTEEILWSRINDLDHPLKGRSPIVSLKYPLSNTEGAYKYLNIISNEKGAIGMLSNDSKDAMGAMPLTDEEKTNIERTYRNKYGISEDQARMLITQASLKYTPMSYPTKDLLLLEQIDANQLTIISAFGLDANIFPNKNSTYENVKHGMLISYQDTIIPEADQFTQALSKFIGVKEGFRLEASYGHLAIMKENKLQGMAAIKAVIESLTQAVQSGFMSGDQAENILANELGIPVDTADESKVLNNINRLSPLVSNNVLQVMTVNEQRRLVGLDEVKDGDRLAGEVTPPTTTPQA